MAYAPAVAKPSPLVVPKGKGPKKATPKSFGFGSKKPKY